MPILIMTRKINHLISSLLVFKALSCIVLLMPMISQFQITSKSAALFRFYRLFARLSIEKNQKNKDVFARFVT